MERDNAQMRNFAQSRTAALILVITAVSGFSFSMGMTYPVVALVLESQGFSETEIGINGAMAGLGLLISAFTVPRISRSITYRAMISISAALGCAIILSMIWIEGFYVWCLARFFLAVCVNGIFIGTEAWLNELLEEKQRGTVIGIYASVISATFALGPSCIPLIGFAPPLPFILCAVVIAMSGLIVLPLKKWDAGASGGEGGSIFAMIVVAPVMMFSVLAMGFFEAAAMSLFPIYALGRGYSGDLAALMVAALAFGSVIAQPFVGKLSDLMNANWILFFCAIISASVCAIIPFLALDTWGAFLALGILGGTTFGAYTLTLVTLGRRFKGPKLAAAMACSALAWGAGGVIGPAISGPSMDFYGNDALLFVLTGLFGLLTIFTVIRRTLQKVSFP